MSAALPPLQSEPSDVRQLIAEVLCIGHHRRQGRPCRACVRGARAVIALLAPRPDLVQAMIAWRERRAL